MNQFRYFLLFCFITSLSVLYARQIEDHYDSYFQKIAKPETKWGSFIKATISTDSTIQIDGKHPVCLSNVFWEQTNTFLKIHYQISQKFRFPEGSQKIRISLLCKTQNVKSKIEVTVCNKQEEILQRKSILFCNSTWKKNELEIDTNLDEAKYFVIRISDVNNEIGNTIVSNKELQKVWLAHLSCQIDGKEISRYQIDQDVKNNDTLNYKHLTNYQSVSNFKLPKQFAKTKIVGIGEAMHTNFTINEAEISIYKDWIQFHNCKLILMEIPLSVSIPINAYIQGRCSRETLEKALSLYPIFSDPQFISFLDWLYSYNKNAELKVRLLGIDSETGETTRILFDFLTEIYTSKNSETLFPIMRELLTGGCQKAIQDSALIKKWIFLEEYNLFLCSLHGYKEAMQRMKHLSHELWIYQSRDSIMFNNSRRMIQMFAPENEKVLIWGHFLHLKKQEGLSSTKPLGTYISQHYKDQYKVCIITSGKGYIAAYQDQEMRYQKMKPLHTNSIEELCDNSSSTPFGVFTQYIPKEYDLIRFYGISGESELSFCSLESNAEWFYYIPESPLKEITYKLKDINQFMNERFSIIYKKK